MIISYPAHILQLHSHTLKVNHSTHLFSEQLSSLPVPNPVETDDTRGLELIVQKKRSKLTYDKYDEKDLPERRLS